LLERLGDIDQRHAAFARGKAGRHPGGDDIGAAAGDHLLGRDIGAARLDFDGQAFFFIKALGLGDIDSRRTGPGSPI
jgi:hypothetical protein